MIPDNIKFFGAFALLFACVAAMIVGMNGDDLTGRYIGLGILVVAVSVVGGLAG